MVVNEPLISIIIPVYKVEAYLARSINSVINQTYKKLEIILVDDGSPDSCPRICDEFATKDSRIKVIHKENGGLSSARNAGLDICHGDYITFVDSDDWVSPQYAENLCRLALESEADIAIGEHTKSGEKEPSKRPCKESIKIFSSKEALLALFQNKHLSFTVSWGKLYKRSLFSNLRFPISKFHEDNFTTYLLFYASKKIIYTTQILYFYFQRSNSIMAQRHPWDVLEYLEQQYLFFTIHKENDILYYIRPELCWQHLCAFWFESTRNKQKAQSHLNRFKQVTSELSLFNVSFKHLIPLRIFSYFPDLYIIYRNNSPFLIRDKF